MVANLRFTILVESDNFFNAEEAPPQPAVVGPTDVNQLLASHLHLAEAYLHPTSQNYELQATQSTATMNLMRKMPPNLHFHLQGHG